jgi:hypothetical protein
MHQEILVTTEFEFGVVSVQGLALHRDNSSGDDESYEARHGRCRARVKRLVFLSSLDPSAPFTLWGETRAFFTNL